MTLVYKEINGFRDAMRIRGIRNHVRLFMTRNTHYISVPGQIRWYYRVYKPERREGKAQAYLVYDGPRLIGYGLILVKNERWWVSGGLLPMYRGCGFGEQLFQKLTDITLEATDESWLEVLKTNTRAKSLYRKLGYAPIEGNDNMILMKKAKS